VLVTASGMKSPLRNANGKWENLSSLSGVQIIALACYVRAEYFNKRSLNNRSNHCVVFIALQVLKLMVQLEYASLPPGTDTKVLGTQLSGLHPTCCMQHPGACALGYGLASQRSAQATQLHLTGIV